MLEADKGDFNCPKCGGPTRIFYSTKTGDRSFWTCIDCGSRGYWAVEKAIIMA